MLALIVVLLLVFIIVGLFGVLLKGLFFLTIIAGVLFLATIFFGGSRLGKSRASR